MTILINIIFVDIRVPTLYGVLQYVLLACGCLRPGPFYLIGPSSGARRCLLILIFSAHPAPRSILLALQASSAYQRPHKFNSTVTTILLFVCGCLFASACGPHRLALSGLAQGLPPPAHRFALHTAHQHSFASKQHYTH